MAASQRETLRLFTALRLAQTVWAGSLLTGVGLHDAGQALALASLAAGAASIFLEADTTQVRSAQREGCCTCTVTSLDEALRIVKNELRQRRAITVALRGEPAVWLREMVERGVQPQAFATTRELSQDEDAPVAELRERGMQTFSGPGLYQVADSGVRLDDVLVRAEGGAWAVHEEVASSVLERRAQDALLLQAATQQDPLGCAARKWLHVAPTLFPRAHARSYWRKA